MMLFSYSLLVFTLLFLCPSDTFAKMYKWVDKAGKTHFSDNPPNPKNTGAFAISDNKLKNEKDVDCGLKFLVYLLSPSTGYIKK